MLMSRLYLYGGVIMKKLICIVIVFCLLFGIACAQSMDDRLSDTFERCKCALSSMSQGNFDGAVNCLKLDAKMANRLYMIVKTKCPDLIGIVPQTDYAVAWVENAEWYLSVPVVAPSFNAVPCAVFKLNEEYGVISVDFTNWSDVSSRYAQSPMIRWKVEYIPGFVAVID